VETAGPLLKTADLGGVCPLLFAASGYAALQRGSASIEIQDLIRAIYIVDLEHVAKFWIDWEGFERFVSAQLGSAGRPETYINRIWFLIQLQLAAAREEGTLTPLARPSVELAQVVAAARDLASKRSGNPSTPSSGDLLFCVCSREPSLAAGLRASGLQLEKLRDAVGESGEGGPAFGR
jgi:hypothetical protein